MSVSEQQNNKRIAKNTLLLYFRMLLTMGISLYTSRIVLGTLGEVDFGIYNVVGGFVAMFTVISGAMTTATQRFLSFEIGKREMGNVRALFSTAVIIHLLLAIIIFLLAETFGLWFLNNYMKFPADRYDAANWVFQFSLLTFVINVISVPYNAAIVAYERMKAFAYVSIIEVSLKLFIVYLLVISPYDKLIIYVIFLALIAIIIRIIYGYYCYHNFRACRFDWRGNKQYAKQMSSFVSWNLIGSIAGVMKEQGINIILNIFCGVTVNAARGIAQQVLIAMSGFVNNFQLAMSPHIVKLYAAREKQEMFRLMFRGSRFSFFLLLTLSLPVIIEAPFILKLWLENVPDYTVIFLRLVLLTALIDSLSATLIASMHASGNVRNYQIIVGGISLLTLPLAYMFLKFRFPPYSAMCVTLAMAILCHFVRLILLKKIIDLPIAAFLKQVTFLAFIIAGLSVIFPVLIYKNIPVNFATFIFVCFISVVSSLTFSYFLGINKNERQVIRKKIKLVYNRF